MGAKVIVNKWRILFPKKYHRAMEQRGASLVEVLLAMVIIAVAAPYTYSMISETTHTMHDMAVANDIINMRGDILNFVRINQDLWPENAQIKMSREELNEFSDIIAAGFIDKYTVRGGAVIDVYLAFEFDTTDHRIAQIANYIGMDAAIVGPDKIAYGDSWAVTAPEFTPGNLIYKITRNLSDMDTARFLHRGSSGEDGLNTMGRDLNMGGNDAYNVGGIVGKSIRVRNLDARFVNATEITARNTYFSSGANMAGDGVEIGNLRVSGDISGFRNIDANTLNAAAFSVNGRIIADRASISNSLNVGADLVLKSNTLRTIGGFAGITVGTVYAPYISTNEITFFENFGLTVSGELLISTNSPIRLGSWSFPSTTGPTFTSLTLTRARIPEMPNVSEFRAIMTGGWQTR